MYKIYGEPVELGNFEKYESQIREIQAEAKQTAWSSGTSTLFFMILLIIIVTIIARLIFPFANMLVMLFIFVAEGIALFIPLLIYHHQGANYIHDRCLELETTHPGIYAAYEEWKQRALDKVPDSTV